MIATHKDKSNHGINNWPDWLNAGHRTRRYVHFSTEKGWTASAVVHEAFKMAINNGLSHAASERLLAEARQELRIHESVGTAANETGSVLHRSIWCLRDFFSRANVWAAVADGVSADGREIVGYDSDATRWSVRGRVAIACLSRGRWERETSRGASLSRAKQAVEYNLGLIANQLLTGQNPGKTRFGFESDFGRREVVASRIEDLEAERGFKGVQALLRHAGDYSNQIMMACLPDFT